LVFDGDNARPVLDKDSDLDQNNRNESTYGIEETAKLLIEAGTNALTPLISPFRIVRESVFSMPVSGLLRRRGPTQSAKHLPRPVCKLEET